MELPMRNFFEKFLIALMVAAAPGATCHANDSTAELAAGGLVFVRNDAIEMRAEDLYISTAEIRVRYRFYNKTSKDVIVQVAFPMPELSYELQDRDIAVPTDDPFNMLGFKTSINGRPVTTQVEQRAFAAGVDRTADLRALGVPLASHLDSTNDALNGLPQDKRDELVKMNLAAYDPSSGSARRLSARWTLQTTFHWQTIFPAKKETVIEHRYKPSVGGSAATALGAASARGEQWYEQIVQKYCVEPNIINALDRARRAAGSESETPYTERRIEYILNTGANWSGPIRDFRLVVDKGRTDNLVSFCGDGVKKIGPTRFELRMKNYTPDGNFSLLILEPLARR